MLGLIYKDYLYLYKNWMKWKFIIGIVVALVLSYFFFRESNTVIAILITMLLINSIQILFITDMNSGWLKYLNLSTNIKNRTIVLARILTGFSVCIVSSVFLLLINLISLLIFNEFSFLDYLSISILTFMISLIYILILIPFTYIFNSNGMIFTIIFFLAMSLLFSKVAVFKNTITYLFENNMLLLAFINFLFILFLFIISMLASTMFLNKYFR